MKDLNNTQGRKAIRNFENHGVLFAKADYTREDIYDIYQNGIVKYAKRDFEGAKTDFSKVIKLDNSLADAFYRRGRSNYELREYNEAVKDFIEAKRLNKNKLHDEGYYYLGLGNKAQGFLNEAIDSFTKAFKLRKDYTDALYERGLTYSKQKKYAQAIHDYSKAIQLKPKNYIIYEQRADSEMKVGQIKEAIKDYTFLIENCNSPFLGEYNYARGIAYFKLKKYSKAIIDLVKAAELYKPNCSNYSDRDIFLYRGIAKYNLKQTADAAKDFARTINTFKHYSLSFLEQIFPPLLNDHLSRKDKKKLL